MMKPARLSIYVVMWLTLMSSCGPSKHFAVDFYKENESMLLSLKDRYRRQYNERPFAIELKDKALQNAGLEIINDTIKYVYSLQTSDPALTDTLHKYNFNADLVHGLIRDMQSTHCTWLTNLDYYENLEKRYLVFVSIRHRKLESVFRKDKYFTLAFFENPQPVDEKQRLLDRKDRKRLRRINGAVFFKMTDKVFYALTRQFR